MRRGRIVGEGYHRAFGRAHAEVHALRSAGERAKGATLYVTLEPCSPHPKKTPPCTDLLLRSGLSRVVVAVRDPHPEVNGRGLALLRRGGMKVEVGACSAEATELNAPFFKVHTRGLPYVAVKWAMTIDGKIATRSGDSRWVSNERSRRWLHRWRDSFQAILVGSGTVLRDDPSLRGSKTGPTRIILDTTARTPLDSRIVRTAKEQPTILAVSSAAPASRLHRLERSGVQILQLDLSDLRLVFQAFAREGLHSILVEGGGEVHASVIEGGLADEACVFIAPKVIGGKGARTPVAGTGLDRMAQALCLEGISVERFGDDVMIRGRFPS